MDKQLFGRRWEWVEVERRRSSLGEEVGVPLQGKLAFSKVNPTIKCRMEY
jgi:hypothetical protein